MAHHYSLSALKQSLLHFLVGKLLNGLIGLLTIMLLVRTVGPAEYGVYIAFAALQVSLLAASALGIETAAERFLPEFRSQHDDRELSGLVLLALGARAATLLLLVVAGWLVAPWLTAALGLADYVYLFRLWLLAIFCNGMLALSVALLEAMLHQRQAARCTTVYSGLRLLLLLSSMQAGTLDLAALVYVEIAAAGVAAITACTLLLRRFSGPGWRSGWEIALRHRQRMGRFAVFNYSAQLVFQLFNAQAMKLLVTRLLGLIQAGRYGFVYNLSDTVQRYLPAQLLLRLIKPVFVSRYLRTRDFSLLNDMARLILKLNLLLLTPGIALAAVYGDAVLGWLSDGRYGDAGWVLVGVLGLLVSSSHQQVLSLLAGTLERNAMQLCAGLASSLALPCAWFLLPLFGIYGAIVSSAIGGLIYNLIAIIYLRRAGYDYRPDGRGALIFMLAGAALCAVAGLMRLSWPGMTGGAMALLLGAPVYLLIVRGMGAFSDAERAMLNAVLPRKVFVF
ncbi:MULTISPECIES: lipopolysaccharide biosynthesis protein [unclassified Duganella]|uniref:oligosaccharide flippase family protein n=1 Tax=unclassified Duganella TaxID=2636909 RepID=UPI000881AA3C|nr:MULTISPECIES: lipopolysaccharide biosynthesis protein [unclassified Duganella]SDH36174.1 Membrane protein involved in the export of O-antigen and teichoic acid [Duganella sp. OV458]SDK52556.1 Membrane protein involved in the export of O-antigen and teichoic acid [Duganella sp. OV510]